MPTITTTVTSSTSTGATVTQTTTEATPEVSVPQNTTLASIRQHNLSEMMVALEEVRHGRLRQITLSRGVTVLEPRGCYESGILIYRRPWCERDCPTPGKALPTLI